MAKSESQGLQIAVITFALLTIAFSISTYWFFNDWSKARDRLAAEEKAASDQLAAQKIADSETLELREMVFGPGVELKSDRLDELKTDILAKVTKEASLAGEEQNYRKALEKLVARLMQDKALVDKERQDLVALVDRINALETSMNNALAQLTNSFISRNQDFDKRFAAFVENEDQVTNDKLGRAEDLRAKRQELADLEIQMENELSALQRLLDKTVANHETISKEVDGLKRQEYTGTDGVVRWVNIDAKLVWINLGAADKLPPALRFNVFDRDSNNVVQKTRKAEIEITRILGDYLAEAGILSDELLNPIKPGDLVDTAIWSPGKREHFGIAGVLDVDGSGAEEPQDRQIIYDLISVVGGIIDAELLADGQVRGEMNVNTRYLILGQEPTDHAEAYNQLKAEAQKLGVELLTLDKFLDHVRFTDAQKVLTLSKPPAEAGAAADVPGTFRPRRPPQGKNGAF
jgi:hypothetical protein